MEIDLPPLKIRRPDQFAFAVLQTIATTCLGVFPHMAWSQVAIDSGTKPTFSVTPRVSVSERYTDNVFLQSSGKQSELITQISPGISVTSQAGRIQGTFDYSLNELLYARNSSGRQSQNALNSSGRIEAVDNWAFIDLSGNISQQAISAFGTQSKDPFAVNSNSTETSVYRVSPYLRGRLGGAIEYEARYSWSTTRSASDVASDIRTTDASLRLNGATGGPLGWNVEATSDDSNYSLGNAVLADRLKVGLTYSVNAQLNLSLTGARESNNYTSAGKESHGSAGVGLNWSVSELTKLVAQLERRSFGQSHNLSFEHRTARTVWRISDSQDVSSSPVQSGIGAVGSLSELLSSQFASLEPDPVKRAALVNSFIQDNGLNANTNVISNFLAASASLQRQQEISFALLGVRDTITFMLNRSSNSKLDNVVTFIDSTSNASVIRQTGASIAYAHRLTPDVALNLSASRQNTSGSIGLQSTSLRSVDVAVSGRVGRQMNASVGARRVFFDSVASPYTETAVTGMLSVQF